MASGMAIGGFAQGLSQGLQSGFGIGKAMRENEKWELEKPQLEQQADLAKRKQAAQQQAREQFDAWNKSRMFDANGQPLPPDQAPTELERNSAFFNIQTKSLLDNQVLDPDQFMKVTQYSQELKKQGLLAAINDYYTKGEAAALKTFNATGDKAPEGTRLVPINDGTIKDVAIIGPDGKQIGTFNQALFYMSFDNVARHVGDMEKLKVTEAGQDRRTAVSAGAQLEATRLNNAGAMDRELIAERRAYGVARLGRAATEDPAFKAIQQATGRNIIEKFASNPLFAQDPARLQRLQAEVDATAYEFLRTGRATNPAAAAAMAFKELGLGETPKPAPKK